MSNEQEIPDVIFLKGNISEGFMAYGPYEDMDEADNAHMSEEGWLMTLIPKKTPQE
jgi:hypothetical protein